VPGCSPLVLLGFCTWNFGSRTVFSSIFSAPPAAVFFVQIFDPRVSGLVPAEVRPVSSSCTRAEKISVFLPFSRLRAAWSASHPPVSDFPRAKALVFFPSPPVWSVSLSCLRAAQRPAFWLSRVRSSHPGAHPHVRVSVKYFVAPVAGGLL
jgi:hypothetical protein